MNRIACVPFGLLATLFLSACPDSEEAKNPPKLWLYLLGSERVVQLVPYEPEPF